MVCSFSRKRNSNEKNSFYLRQRKESYKPNIIKNTDTKAKTKNNHTTWPLISYITIVYFWLK